MAQQPECSYIHGDHMYNFYRSYKHSTEEVDVFHVDIRELLNNELGVSDVLYTALFESPVSRTDEACGLFALCEKNFSPAFLNGMHQKVLFVAIDGERTFFIRWQGVMGEYKKSNYIIPDGMPKVA